MVGFVHNGCIIVLSVSSKLGLYSRTVFYSYECLGTLSRELLLKLFYVETY